MQVFNYTQNKKIDIFKAMRHIFQNKATEEMLSTFDKVDMPIDEIILWIEENIPREYKNEALANAYYALGKADVFRGRIYRDQSWRFLIYQNIFQSAGIAYAKKTPTQGFTKYENPKRILKIWLHNQKIEKKKTISKKYAKLVHCSLKRVMRDFDLIRPILKKPLVQEQMRLSDEEVDFLNK